MKVIRPQNNVQPNTSGWPGGDTAIKTWLTAYSSPHTRVAYANDIRRWLDWLDLYGVDLTDARRGDVDAYRSEMEDARCNSAVAPATFPPPVRPALGTTDAR